MGFCRRCGEIVVGVRCKCGGGAVAAVVQWSQDEGASAHKEDRWSKTYTREKAPSTPEPTKQHAQLPPQQTSSTSPVKRFPRPNSSSGTGRGGYNNPAPQLGSRVSAHIASTTAYRPPSPLKHSSSIPDDESSYKPEDGILPAPNSASLIKVHGSILERNLATHCCGMCAAPFPPDATIYPDPQVDSSVPSNQPAKFLCKPCFTANGGSKGTCPTCTRPVLTLKSEGGFIQAAGKVWHKRCFRCDGCYKDIGDTPMVDLLGHPTCADCFDSCLKRESPRRTAPKEWESSPRNDNSKAVNLGGMSMGRKSREGSPAIEELEQRLGISKGRESSSAALDELTSRLSIASQRTPVKDYQRQQSSPAAAMRSPPSTSRYSRDNSPLPPVRTRTHSGVEFTSAFATRAMEASPSPARRSYAPANTEGASPRGVGSPSPVRSHITGGGGSPAVKPTEDAIEEMKRRFLRGGSASPAPSPTTTPLRTSRARTRSPASRSPAVTSPTPTSLSSRIPVRSSIGSPIPNRYSGSPSMASSVPSTPDLMSDFSDAPSEGTDSPPRSDIFGYGDNSFSHEEEDVVRSLHSTPTHKAPPSKLKGLGLADLPVADSGCAKCGRPLFTAKDGGKFVTVPEDPGSNKRPKTYHTACFTCVMCDGVFREGGKGQAVFVRAEAGPCHVECAPPEKISFKPVPSKTKCTPAFSFKDVIDTPPPQPAAALPLPHSPSSSSSRTSTSTWSRPPQSAPATSSIRTFPRFGGGTACPGCHKSVSAMEFGVVPGPQGSRWHATCLVCGGKVERGRSVIWGRDSDRDKSKPGCGKKLDSAAKTDGDGSVWCRECLLLLPAGMRGDSPAGSPTRSPAMLSMHHTGGSRVATQYTGTTTIAKQFTGLGGLERQMTGGGLSPTRQLTSSPTKGFDGPGPSGVRPRPKSVTGMRSSKSVDFGRGMMLVRQLTGGAPAN